MGRGKVGIYTAKWVQDRNDPRHLYPDLAKFPLWVANYTDALFPLMPTYWDLYHLWQYSADGNNRGHEFGQTSEDADLSLYNGDLDDFYTWVGFNAGKDEYIPLYKDTTTVMELCNLIYDPTIHLFYKKDLK